MAESADIEAFDRAAEVYDEWTAALPDTVPAVSEGPCSSLRVIKRPDQR